MDGKGEVANRSTSTHHNSHFVDEVTGMGTEDVSTENRSVGHNEDLDETIFGIHRKSFSIGTIERLEYLVFCSSFGELLFGLPNHSHFGCGEDCCRDDCKGGVVGVRSR